MQTRRIGAHVPASGGLAKRAIKYAQDVSAETIQVFVSNPRGWATPEGNPADDERFRGLATELNLSTWVHAPFLINLGSPTETTYQNSLNSIQHSINRARSIGALGVVIHTGSAVESSFREKAWKQIQKGALPLVEQLDDSDPWLLLEPTAGQGESLCRKFEDLIEYLNAFKHHPKVGICLDTCHAFAAGYDMAGPGGVSSMLESLISVVGDRLKLIHVNDSKDVCSSLKDRHENLGKGHIGIDPFKDLMNHPSTLNVDFVLETPGEEAEHGSEISKLKSMRK